MSMRSVYRKIAKQNGVSVKEVKEEMQKAIDEAWDNPKKSYDVCSKQMQVLPDGTKPSVEEFIRYCSSEIKQK
ncbi:MAG: sporulation initiation factor Spo0A C-terminal domain-containing protein [Bacteroidales bacterium]|nr:sporulation initiation factor Spo0A C-terminal domain-containing protein [Bacteroidales bacterium]